MNYDSIRECFDKVVEYSQEFSGLDTEVLFQRWYDAKKDFIDKLGDKLIYEFPEPVTLALDDKIKEGRLDSFINWVGSGIDADLADFFLANMNGFFGNKTCVPFLLRRAEGIWIPAGIKIGKALKYFTWVPANDLENVRQEMSRILQENKVQGTLCASVHPLDFISSSENNYNWRSCHSLDGEYRSGNLSYMVDKCTVVIYLKGDEDVVLPNFPPEVPWNNKKWRCLFFVDPANNLIWAGRQYPFFTNGALDIVVEDIFKPNKYFGAMEEEEPVEWIKVLSKEEAEARHVENVSGHNAVIERYGKFHLIRNLVRNGYNSLHFNDLLFSSLYLPYALTPVNPRTKEDTQLTIGESAPCVMCGESEIADSEIMICRECLLRKTEIINEIVIECDNCGERMFASDSCSPECEDICEPRYYCMNCMEELGFVDFQ